MVTVQARWTGGQKITGATPARSCARTGTPSRSTCSFAQSAKALRCPVLCSWTNEGCPGVHTGERADERFPWITVDLGATHLIHTVQIWNRVPCPPYSTYLCQSRLWKYAIYVGDVPPPQPLPEQGNYAVNTPCARQERGQPLGMYANVPCAATGRYVTLQQTGSLDADIPGVMNICQLRVFGEALAPPTRQAGRAARASKAGAVHLVTHRRAADFGRNNITRKLLQLHTALMSGGALCAAVTCAWLARRTAACLLLRRRLRNLVRRDMEHAL